MTKFFFWQFYFKIKPLRPFLNYLSFKILAYFKLHLNIWTTYFKFHSIWPSKIWFTCWTTKALWTVLRNDTIDISVCPMYDFADWLSCRCKKSFNDVSRKLRNSDRSDVDVMPFKNTIDAIASTALSWKQNNFFNLSSAPYCNQIS